VVWIVTDTDTTASRRRLHPAHEGRPRIGLVSRRWRRALGFAHIGVIRWLEQKPYPSGLRRRHQHGRASSEGSTPQAIVPTTIEHNRRSHRLANSARRTGSFSGTCLPAQGKTSSLIQIAWISESNTAVSLPSGLNSGGEVSLVFTSNLPSVLQPQKASTICQFPSAALRPEMVSGKAKVFDSGSLPHALRATMSIPAVLCSGKGRQMRSTPTAVRSITLPVDVCTSRWGADIVIAVYLDTGPITPASLKSIVGVAGRNVAIMVACK